MINRQNIAKARHQQGLSFIGFILVLGLALFVAYLGVRIVPIYLEYYSVVSIMHDMESEEGAGRLTGYEIRARMVNQLNLNYTESIDPSNITIRGANGVQLRVKYEVRKPIVGNLDVVVHFDKTVQLSY